VPSQHLQGQLQTQHNVDIGNSIKEKQQQKNSIKKSNINIGIITKKIKVLRFEVLTAVVIKSTIFWDIKPCSSLSQPTFRRNISPPFSGSKNKPSKKPA
jgi:hypothetical protein